jgi:hypothetical protein
MWAFFLIIGFAAVGVVIHEQTLPLPPSKTLDTSVSWSNSAVLITNRHFEAAGTDIRMYLNGTPPSRYRQTQACSGTARASGCP